MRLASYNFIRMLNTDSPNLCASKHVTSAVVRDRRLHLDTELSMKHHLAKVAAICYYHVRRLRQIRRRVGKEITTRLVLAMVISRLDYCNAELAGLPQATVAPQQRV